jgi:hypothetical protein
MVEWIPSNKQRADGLTKLLPRLSFNGFRQGLGMSIYTTTR